MTVDLSLSVEPAAISHRLRNKMTEMVVATVNQWIETWKWILLFNDALWGGKHEKALACVALLLILTVFIIINTGWTQSKTKNLILLFLLSHWFRVRIRARSLGWFSASTGEMIFETRRAHKRILLKRRIFYLSINNKGNAIHHRHSLQNNPFPLCIPLPCLQ